MNLRWVSFGSVLVSVVALGVTLSAQVEAAASPPTVTGVSPASGPDQGGNTVSVAGTGLASVSKVSFGSAASTRITHVSASLIYVVAPKHATDRVDVHATSTAGTSRATASDLYYYSPGAKKVSWSRIGQIKQEDDGDQPQDISCAAQNHCVVIGATGWVHTWNGHYAGDVHADTTAQAAATHYGSISCPTTTFCVTVGSYEPYPAQSVEPVKALIMNGSTWSGPVDLHDDNNLAVDVSCSSPKLCVVIDDAGHAIVYRNGTWAAPQTVDRTRSMNSVSCPSDTFCLAVTATSRYLTFNGTTWSALQQAQFPGDANGFFNVDCTMTTSCVASTKAFAPVYRRGTTWGVGRTLEDSEGEPGEVACATTRFCLFGQTSSDPHGLHTYAVDGAAGASTPNPIFEGGGTPTSCGSATQCAEVNTEGQFAFGTVAS